MATYRRPGTYIEEITLSQNVESQGLEISLGAFVGMALRGPVDQPAFVSSWTEFTRRFGVFRSADGRQAYRLAQAVYQFFSNGGRGAWIQRVIGAGAARAVTSFTDSGTQPVLNVSAIDPGDWAVGNLFVQITDAFPSGDGGVNMDGDTFTVAVFHGGVTPGHVVERWTDLSLDPRAPRYAPDVINGRSTWIHAERPEATGYLPPTPNSVPVALTKPDGTTTSLDGDAAPAADAYIAAADKFDATPSNLIFNVPDAYDMTDGDASSVYSAFIVKADARGDAFVVVDVPRRSESTAAGALTWLNTVNASGNAAAYFPSVKILNPETGSGGGLITVPPGGGVIGLYHSVDSSAGVFKSPAGVGASLSNVVDVALPLSPATQDEMNTSVKPLNVIKPVPGAGICVMGARTMGGTRNLRYVGARRTMLNIKKSLREATNFAVMENNDQRLWEQVRTVCLTYLNELWQAGGLKGATPAEAFYVKCDATNNTKSSIDAGVLNVEVGVALQTPAEFVVIRIGQFDGGTSVTEQ